ncbi:RNA-binding protein Cwf29 [Coemansia sp. Benny D115]|nr:RNA-binding protein Cwf29 [Coemansia sp. Benny D115]
MNVVQEIRRINEAEAQQGAAGSTGSWHDEYKDSAYIYIGGLSVGLTEGDVICVFSQYGEIVNINLVRDKETGKSRGYCFLQYEDQRSTILAVDNFNGAKLLGRTLRVDHVKNYRQPGERGEDGSVVLPEERVMNAAPRPIAEMQREDKEKGAAVEDDEALMREAGIDPEDPMAEYYLEKYKKKMRKRDKKSKSESKSRRDDENEGSGRRKRRHGRGQSRSPRRSRSPRSK